MDIDIAIKEIIKSLSMRIVPLCDEIISNDFRNCQTAFQLRANIVNVETNIKEIESLDNMDDIMHRSRSAIKKIDEIACLMKPEYGKLYQSIYVDCKKLIKLLRASVNTLNNK